MNIFALSSGKGPSGIAIVRISGPQTLNICKSLTNEKKYGMNLEKLKKGKPKVMERLLKNSNYHKDMLERFVVKINIF